MQSFQAVITIGQEIIVACSVPSFFLNKIVLSEFGVSRVNLPLRDNSHNLTIVEFVGMLYSLKLENILIDGILHPLGWSIIHNRIRILTAG
ncbi:hypothetical protein D3C76_1739000 [compost metagenome]